LSTLSIVGEAGRPAPNDVRSPRAQTSIDAMSAFDLAAIFLVLIGLVGWLNVRLLNIPTATAMVLAGLAGGGLLLAASTWMPDQSAASQLTHAIGALDFPQTVLGYLLAFLLFAGAMQVSLQELRKRFLAIASLATLGVLASTLVVGLGLWAGAKGLGLPLALPWAFVFGALISPTDPIAVLAAVRQGSLSKTLEAVLQGEALFNDGVGIVVFSAAVAIASGGADLNISEAILRVGIEAIGGLLLGWACAWSTIRAMRTIDDYGVEVGLTLALAMGAYSLAHALHISGPIAVVVAGLMVGDQCANNIKDGAEQYVRKFSTPFCSCCSAWSCWWFHSTCAQPAYGSAPSFLCWWSGSWLSCPQAPGLG
jgi:CPA1 family monovalent cation:H+ antiporter